MSNGPAGGPERAGFPAYAARSCTAVLHSSYGMVVKARSRRSVCVRCSSRWCCLCVTLEPELVEAVGYGGAKDGGTRGFA